MTKYHSLGFIRVTEVDTDLEDFGPISTIYIKANKIASIDLMAEHDAVPNLFTRICLQGDEGFCYDINESIDEIFEQLESINPSMR